MLFTATRGNTKPDSPYITGVHAPMTEELTIEVVAVPLVEDMLKQQPEAWTSRI